jgi:glycolate oxidase FAD binding subunit
MTVHLPDTEADLAAIVTQAAREATPLAVRGAGSRSGLGRAIQTHTTVSTAALTGLTLYEPAEMIFAARAGTPVAEIEAALAHKNQMLTFEPMDHRTLYGTTAAPTIGGVVAGNISGPRRIAGGAARDSLIGVRFVNGTGEIIKNGGRVMKNVTGLDLVKLMAGSHGTLGVLTEVTFKVLPRPAMAATLAFDGLSDARAVALLCEAMGTPFEPTGAAHLPARGRGLTALRLEGFEENITYRSGELRKRLAAFGSGRLITGVEHETLWREVRDALPVATPADYAVWRLSVSAPKGATVAAAIKAAHPDAVHYFDWAGGLVWVGLPERADAGAQAIRAAAKAGGGYATLVRASADTRARIPVFDPPPPAVAALSASVKRSFDPHGILNPGFMAAGA